MTLQKYLDFQISQPCVTWRWKLMYCDEHRLEKIQQAFARFPEVMLALSTQTTEEVADQRKTIDR